MRGHGCPREAFDIVRGWDSPVLLQIARENRFNKLVCLPRKQISFLNKVLSLKSAKRASLIEEEGKRSGTLR